MKYRVGVQDHNRRFKLFFEFGLGKAFAPTRLIISIFHRLIANQWLASILNQEFCLSL